ncbi:uncharacterized protein [Sinocyclocheilus grahami]|uniref:uncharacterized protein n=1 Tax=Sinocyclocheilus grahami TaxID=75366 RepID=UPI0007AD36FB|nr:PREDICTED: uncharacterized protein LOC107558658 [Sinocyclocheilus grahami]
MGNPEMDLLAAQALNTEARADNTGSHEKMDYAVILKALHEHLIPAAHSLEEQFCPSDVSPSSERYFEERKHLEEFITSIDTITLQNLQTVIDRILVFHERTQMPLSSPARLGEQELFPGSGLYLPHYKLASVLQESRQDSMRLFHLLFEHFFSEEDLNGAVAFGKRGKVPDGKKILDRRRVDGIMCKYLKWDSQLLLIISERFGAVRFHSSTLKWGDVRLLTTETGLECLEWTYQDFTDPNARNRRSTTEYRIYATPHAPQTCPVQDYKEYAQRRPQAMLFEDAPFYLSIKPVVNLAALHWYNCQALGKNKLAKMVKTMCEKGNIPGRKTNFSVYQSCSSLSEAQSNQLVLICNDLRQQAVQSGSSHPGSTNFVIAGSFDSTDSA